MTTPITIQMDGMLLNWIKAVGDSVKQGEIIAEVEADKATIEIVAEADGVLLSQAVAVGENITTGQSIGVIGANGESSAPAPAASAPAQAVAEARAAGAAVIAAVSAAPEFNGNLPDGVKASPIARKIAEERGIDLRLVTGTGPGGRIVKEDVEAFDPAKVAPAAAAPSAPAPAAPSAAPAAGFQPVPGRKLPEGPDVEYIDLTTMRKRIVAVTVESKQQVPHFYVTTEIDVEALLTLRKQINEGLPDDSKVSVNDLIVKACALNLRQFPNLNSHYYGDRIVRHKRIHIGIAVALPVGLLNVVARDADKVSLGTLAKTNKDMIARAREGKVKPEDIGGATFTVSNLGPYDVEHFLAIINPPEAAILAVGTALKVPVVKGDGTLGIGNRMKATISVDHRVSDGAEGAQFMQALKGMIENPMRLLL
jgi:pyruvate dehydrogenase E2 component (dihydrolipoamide acetyltransferase)